MLSSIDGIFLSPIKATFINETLQIKYVSIFEKTGYIVAILIRFNKAIIYYNGKPIKVKAKTKYIRNKLTNKKEKLIYAYYHRKYGQVLLIQTILNMNWE